MATKTPPSIRTSTFQAQIKYFVDEKVFENVVIGAEAVPVPPAQAVALKKAISEALEKQDFLLLSQLYYVNNSVKEAVKSLEHAIASKQCSASDPTTLWAKLTLNLLLKDHAAALDALFSLKTALEAPGSGNHKEILYARTLWIHHSLLLIPHADHQNLQVIGETYYVWINVIETTCPYILPYLAYIYILTSPRKSYTSSHFKDVCVSVAASAHLSMDPLTKLLRTPLTLDFSDAATVLGMCCAWIREDGVVRGVHVDVFMRHARVFLATFYTRIHHSVSGASVAALVGVDAADMAGWMEMFVEGGPGDDGVALEGGMSGTRQSVRVVVARPEIYEEVEGKCKTLNDRAAVFEKLAAA